MRFHVFFILFMTLLNLFKFSSGFLSIKNVVIITLWMPLFTYCIICFICVSVFIHWFFFFPASFHFIVFFSCFTACFVFGGSMPYIVNSTWLSIGYFNVSIDEHALFFFFSLWDAVKSLGNSLILFSLAVKIIILSKTIEVFVHMHAVTSIVSESLRLHWMQLSRLLFP